MARVSWLALGLVACGTATDAESELRFEPPNPVTGQSVSVVPAEPTDPIVAWSWFKNSDGVSHTTVKLPKNAVVFGDTWTVRARTSKQESLFGRITIGNAPPVVENLSFLPVDAKPDGRVEVFWEASDPEEQRLRGKVTWFVNDAQVYEGNPFIYPDGPLALGDTLKATVSILDSEGALGEASHESVVGNSAPVLDHVRIRPATVYSTTDVRGEAGITTDADGDDTVVSHQWFINGSPVDGSMASGPKGDFTRGDVIALEAWASDGYVDGPKVRDEVTVGNLSPVVTNVRIDANWLYADTTPRCAWDPPTDPDGDDVQVVRVDWYVNTRLALSDSETFEGVVNERFVAGDDIICTVLVEDEAGAQVQEESPALRVRNSYPTVTDITLTPDDPYRGQSVTFTGGEAMDIDAADHPLTTTATYQWYRSETKAGTNFIAIDGAEQATLSGDELYRGFSIRLDVRFNVRSGQGSHYVSKSSAPVVVQDAPPTATVELVPDPVYTNDVLEVLATPFDPDPADNGPFDIEYTWLLNPDDVSGGLLGVPDGTTQVDGAQWFDVGDTVQVVATVSDGNTTNSASASVMVANSVPTIQDVTVTPASSDPMTSDLTCTVVGADDADGDDLSFHFVWKRNAAVYAEITQDGVENVLPAAQVDGASWHCEVTAEDTRSGVSLTAAGMASVGDPDQWDVDGDGVSVADGDCNDDAPDIFPGGTEVCDAGLADEDCDGAFDEAGAEGCVDLYYDGDGDTYGAGAPECRCSTSPGWVPRGGDCANGTSSVHPGAGCRSTQRPGGGHDWDCSGRSTLCGGGFTYYPSTCTLGSAGWTSGTHICGSTSTWVTGVYGSNGNCSFRTISKTVTCK